MKKQQPIIRYTQAMSVGELLKKVAAQPTRENSLLQRTYVISLWCEVAGKIITKYTRSVSVKDKKLYVELNSSAARNELFMLRSDLVRRINEKAGRVLVEELILR
jgi:predicted nucleic acid-binding Zn ribbon protein